MLKRLRKVVLGLLLFVCVSLLVLHIPFVQQKASSAFFRQLSAKIGSTIEVQRFKFSLFGQLEIDGLTLSDPDSNNLFTAGRIRVQSSVWRLFKGQYNFDEITIEDVQCHLKQKENGLNIQFIFDAFRNPEKEMVTEKEGHYVFRKVDFRNIAIDFSSVEDGLTMVTSFKQIAGRDIELFLGPNSVKADSIIFDQALVSIFSTRASEEVYTMSQEDKLLEFIPNLGIGIDLDLLDVLIIDSELTYHENEIQTTSKFDPSHIEVRDLQFHSSSLQLHQDDLKVDLKLISAEMPGFSLVSSNGRLEMDRHKVNLDKWRIASVESTMEGDFTFFYNMETSSFPDVAIAAEAIIIPEELEYFFSDSIMESFSTWGSTEIALEGNATRGIGELKLLKIESGNSWFRAAGKFEDFVEMSNVTWENLKLEASVGSAFKRIISPYSEAVNIPPGEIDIQVISNGNLSNVYLNAQLSTTWGNVSGIGTLIPSPDHFQFNLGITGEQLNLGQRLGFSWLGPMNLDGHVKGSLGKEKELMVKGMIKSISLFDDTIYQVELDGSLKGAELFASISIGDPRYSARIQSVISLTDTIGITVEGHFSELALGDLLLLDSTFLLSGAVTSSLWIADSTYSGNVKGKQILLQNGFATYVMDTILCNVFISPTNCHLDYMTDFGNGILTSNFDLRTLPTIFTKELFHGLRMPAMTNFSGGDRFLHFSTQLDKVGPLLLLGSPIDSFGSIRLDGEWDEHAHALQLNAFADNFEGYEAQLDTFQAQYILKNGSASVDLNAKNLIYNSIRLGDMNFTMRATGDTAVTNLLMSNDSLSWLDFGTHILATDSGMSIYPARLIAFENDYMFKEDRPVILSNNNIVFDDFVISHDAMSIRLTGDRNAFDLSCQHFDLTGLNPMLSEDSALIDGGILHGNISYSRNQHLDVRAHIDSLSLYHSLPLHLDITAETDTGRIPFQCLVSSQSNTIDIGGIYFLDRKEVEASVFLELSEPKALAFLYADVLDDLHGKIRGEAKVYGPLEKPVFDGSLNFLNVGFTTTTPAFTFYLEDETIVFDDKSVHFEGFKIFDRQHRPLTISGVVTNDDYKAISYDLHLLTDNFGLIDQPYTASEQLTGLMVIGGDIHLTGTGKDADVNAALIVRDTTSLTLALDNDADHLLNTEGILQFVEPGLLFDTTSLQQNTSLYDSLLAGLPNIRIHGSIKIEDKSSLRIIPDAQSGDYFEVAGSANLDFSYDRTGNPFLSGEYIVASGMYRLSFHDLVRKDFQLVPGSSINWSGSPKAGALDIKATYIVQSNSIGLIGDEISDSEKSTYKKSLDYEVGINIKGVVEKPIVSFSLDLPAADKINYPVLANKLDRLRLPEFQSDLNKQVFGILVLGSFLPGGADADENQSQIATNALYNSVNSLMSSQLNRLAGQYVKGLDIDVGLQSYSDYSTPGGKTQTAMDFRVSKSIMDDRLSIEVGGDFDISEDQSGSNSGNSYRGDVAFVYDLTGNGDKLLKLFNNESYDIVYQEIRNTGISIIFIREFNKDEGRKKKDK